VNPAVLFLLGGAALAVVLAVAVWLAAVGARG